DREQALSLEPSLARRMVGANYYPDDHQVDPVLLSKSLAATVARLGGVFCTGRRALGLLVQGHRAVGVRTDQGNMAAEHVVIAGGAWSTTLADLPPLRTSLKPLAGQMVQVETSPPLLRHVVYGYGGYIVPRPDGRILLGSTLEDRGFDKAVTLDGVRRISAMALDLVPALAAARLLTHWSGLRPATGDGRPMLGAGPLAGLYFATGHFRNGILMTPVTGRVVQALVTGAEVPWDLALFAPGGVT
ncbi:MAG: FAD-dependent oxidoreductase, partial [Magnetococcus sp. WYHC-3]